jgi:hypothetical protein
MGTDPQAKLFYGIILTETDEYGEIVEEEEYYVDGIANRAADEMGLKLGLLGYDGCLLTFVCVTESLTTVEWSDTMQIESFHVAGDWDSKLLHFVGEKINIGKHKDPAWTLGCLYF